jgi:hypothetical protein
VSPVEAVGGEKRFSADERVPYRQLEFLRSLCPLPSQSVTEIISIQMKPMGIMYTICTIQNVRPSVIWEKGYATMDDETKKAMAGTIRLSVISESFLMSIFPSCTTSRNRHQTSRTRGHSGVSLSELTRRAVGKQSIWEMSD